jgi:hypothetical protein
MRLMATVLGVPAFGRVRFTEEGAAGAGTQEEVRRLQRLAAERLSRGLAPPPEIYKVPYRERLDWSGFPEWARPSDPELFQGCSHEG